MPSKFGRRAASLLLGGSKSPFGFSVGVGDLPVVLVDVFVEFEIPTLVGSAPLLVGAAVVLINTISLLSLWRTEASLLLLGRQTGSKERGTQHSQVLREARKFLWRASLSVEDTVGEFNSGLGCVATDAFDVVIFRLAWGCLQVGVDARGSAVRGVEPVDLSAGAGDESSDDVKR
jgi:hypothetical protein